MKYKCLILDHDDTVVASTEAIHYPSFIEYLKIARPGLEKNYTFESFINKNFNPGILSLLCDEVGLNERELDEEQEFWSNFVNTRVPAAYSGMGELISRFREMGGIIAVSSHSMNSFIERDYRENGLPMPDVIYGWDMQKELRKPSPYAVEELMRIYVFERSEILMVDDLKPGFDMARAAGIDFAAAGWGYDVPEIKAFMTEHSDFYLNSVSELEKLLFKD